MAEMSSRKRKLCCGLSSCCNRSDPDALEKLAKKTSEKEMTFKEKISTCSCWPFSLCKRPKVADGMGKKSMMDEKPSFWRRICCCSSCCKSDEHGAMKGSEMKVSQVERMFSSFNSSFHSHFPLKEKINIKSNCNGNLI